MTYNGIDIQGASISGCGLLNGPGLTVLNYSLTPLILNKWLNELTCLSAVRLDLQVGQQPNQMKITIGADGDRMLVLI